MRARTVRRVTRGHCSSCVEYERARRGNEFRNGMSPSSRTITTFFRTTIHQRETVFESRCFHASYPSVWLDFGVVRRNGNGNENENENDVQRDRESTWDYGSTRSRRRRTAWMRDGLVDGTMPNESGRQTGPSGGVCGALAAACSL